jgi:hypothetical protein
VPQLLFSINTIVCFSEKAGSVRKSEVS